MKRHDLEKILLIGSGPIVIGQACEFDYSGTQACKALRKVGHKVVLVNSNPATIMTDQDTADRIYIEPLTLASLEQIIERERPQAILGTLGGQTALNLVIELHDQGVLARYGVAMIGATAAAIKKAEDRLLFKNAMEQIGLTSARSEMAYSLEDAHEAAKNIGYPCVVRPAFTLGGTGGGIAHNQAELEAIVADGLRSSLIAEVLIEESIVGWKEYELEVMRDHRDNVVIVCSIENFDAMGVHTGDSITVAPAQTLSDKEYQRMRNAAIAIIREIGVETGGANIQFAVNPLNGQMIVIEMNPRVSRSSALASKATGFPIAKFAALLAVGYSLDEIQNDITRETPACFEPTIDYVVTKIPRFNFDKFSECPAHLGTAMRAVGEVMAIGRTFKESLQKGLRSLETKRFGLGFDGKDLCDTHLGELIAKLKTPNPERIFYIKLAFEHGFTVEQIYTFTKIDPWFLHQIHEIVNAFAAITDDPELIYYAKRMGFSDHQLALKLGYPNDYSFRLHRENLGIKPTYKLVDTCAGEFAAYTPYFYSTYELEDEVSVSTKKKIIILGSGPNRIGQGIEFDYACVHGAMACRDAGYEAIMINSNPETVSTDFDTSDRLYFEPITFEDVLNIWNKEQAHGLIVQFGGQTPLNLCRELQAAGVKILGTSPESIDSAEDREKFKQLVEQLEILQPKSGIVYTPQEGLAIAKEIGVPVLARPSYVLGGAAMRVCYSADEVSKYIALAQQAGGEDQPIIIDRFLEDAVEIDVDAVCDGQQCIIAGIMEHIEEAGIHSGDSACCLPPYSLNENMIMKIELVSKSLALALNVRGLLNLQFAVKNDQLYVIEANPRASRTIPFVSKATGVQWAKIATQIMLGATLRELKPTPTKQKFYAIKEAVLPFKKFPGSDPVLGPEMRSTGEVMGIDYDLGFAFLKAQIAAGSSLNHEGNVVILYDESKEEKVKELIEGFTLHQINVRRISQKSLGEKKNYQSLLQQIEQNDVSLLVSLPFKSSIAEERELRLAALVRNIPLITTVRACQLALKAVASARSTQATVKTLTEYYLPRV
jgi:carbamoyl-phosphate synthase large subunit